VITDTQIISYYFKGAVSIPAGPIRISSITAAEFLLIQSPVHNRANYYPILPARLRHRGIGMTGAEAPLRLNFDSRRHSALGKRRTDQLILDFGQSVPTYVEFGSIAITQLINERHEQLYGSSIGHLEKDLQKKLRERYRFLLDLGVTCVAVTPDVATVAMNLLGQFLDRYQTKDNARNTVNDVLVLATAIENASVLKTEDNLLRRFAAEAMGTFAREEPGHLLLDFSAPEATKRRRSLESKGYVNRGWQILERRGR
jgi:hypothetical protein